MANQYVNKFVKDGVTKLDLTGDTVTPETLAEGVTAHDASGAAIEGTMQGGLEMNIKFAEGTESIPAYLFFNNHGTGNTSSTYPIETVDINGVGVGHSAFFRCRSLKTVRISNNVASIGANAFYECTSIDNIVIPDSVTSLGSSIFEDCDNLTSVQIDSEIISSRMFAYCYKLANVTIGNNVKTIGERAFYSCSLTSITIPNSVTSIGNFTFDYCKKLKKITINKPQGSISGAPWGATNATVVWTG